MNSLAKYPIMLSMNHEFEFDNSFPGEDRNDFILSQEFVTPFGFDPELPINSGGLEVSKMNFGETSYRLISHFDEDTKSAIENLCGDNKNILRKKAFGDILHELQPYVEVGANALTFNVSQTPVLLISNQGVKFNIDGFREDGSIMRANFIEGKCNPPHPDKSKFYQFVVRTLQDEPVLVKKGIEYSAELIAGIKLRTLDVNQIKKILRTAHENKCLTSENIQKIINPYFRIRLRPYIEIINEQQELGGF